MPYRIACLALVVLLATAGASVSYAQEAGTTATAAGITFQTLPAAQLDGIKEKTGFRFGVLVSAVQAGTAAATAGIKVNDLIFAVGESGVDCAEQAAAEINALNGEITLTSATTVNGAFQGIVYKFQKAAGEAQPQPAGQPAAAAGQAANRAEFAGIVFETLSAEDLDMLKEKIGYRLGVQVVSVKPGSPGAAAGLRATDLVMAVGKIGVDSAEKAVEALQGSTGKVDLATCTLEGDAYQAKVRQITLAAGAAKPQPAGQPQGEALVNKTTNDPIEAYFDMMDFIRTQAWNRKVSTSGGERQRVQQLFAQEWQNLGAQGQAQIQQIPGAWAKLQADWKKWPEADRNKAKAAWARDLLLPTNLLPPPGEATLYQAPGGMGSFEYPGSWTGGLQEINGTAFLFIGPDGQSARWEDVLNAPKSPPGALFALFTLDAQMQQLPSFVAGARLLAQQLLPNDIQRFKEVTAIPLGQEGALIVYLGRFAGQTSDSFFWIGVQKFGASQAFAGRLGGPVSQAETLLPAFRHMLMTLKLNPPVPSGGGSGWRTAWDRIETAQISSSWAKFNDRSGWDY